MDHRPDTRSKTLTGIIDLTQDSPVPTRRRTRLKRRDAALPVEAIPVLTLEPTESREATVPTVPKESLEVPKERKEACKPKTSILPCLNTSLAGTPEVILCAICFGSMSASREPTTTRCGHVFCKECLTTSLTKRKRCPTCQSVAHISKCFRIYFS